MCGTYFQRAFRHRRDEERVGVKDCQREFGLGEASFLSLYSTTYDNPNLGPLRPFLLHRRRGHLQDQQPTRRHPSPLPTNHHCGEGSAQARLGQLQPAMEQL